MQTSIINITYDLLLLIKRSNKHGRDTQYINVTQQYILFGELHLGISISLYQSLFRNQFLGMQLNRAPRVALSFSYNLNVLHYFSFTVSKQIPTYITGYIQ